MSTYHEFRPPAGLDRSVACLWQGDAGRMVRVVPDGCVDIVWMGGELIVAGADTGPVVWDALPETSGVRLRPGVAGRILGLPAAEVRDQQVPLGAIWPEAERLTEAVVAAGSRERLRLMTEAVLRRWATPDPMVVAAGRLLALPDARVGAVAEDVGVTERHLRRRMIDAVGYGPKVFARVARLRRLVALADGGLADRAYAAGYSSQAHMNDEVRRLTGLTPVRFLEDATLTAA